MSFLEKLKNEVQQHAAATVSETIKNAGKTSWQIIFRELPLSLAALRSLPEATLKEPHFTAALLIPALCIWTVDQNGAMEMINFLKGPQPLSPYEIGFITERLRGKEYVAASYFIGAIPENGYEPSKPYAVTISSAPNSYDEAGYAKLYLKSSGADSPRPVQLRQKPSSGEWFLWEQMLLSDIRPPISADPWA